MSDMFRFEASAWELLENALKPGDTLSAVRFLAATEMEDESVLEDAFEALLEKHVTLVVSDLTADFGSGDMEERLRHEQMMAGQPSMLPELEEDDPLRLYLEELAGIPAQGDTRILADELLRGNEDAAQKLVNLHLHRVVEAAKGYTGRGVLLLDLIQEGSLGLWQGILRYQGGDFESHIDWWIDQSLARVVILQARESGVIRSMSGAMDEYRRADRALLSKLGRSATLEEIAVEIGTTPQQAELARDMLQAAMEMESLKHPPETEEAQEQQAVEDTAYFQSRQRITELLSTLTPQEAQVLSMRFGLDGGAPATVQAIGAKLGMSAEKVVEMEAAALAKLRQQ